MENNKSSKKHVSFNIKVKFKTIPNRDTLTEFKSLLWWSPDEYYYNRCIITNEARLFMHKNGYTNFKQCASLFWADYSGTALIL
uniref:Uncharacterized protein n=1 Tax=viral metagenome TaxID=1070528 RepID=A0A6C0DQV8_9ZZZZ